MELGESVYEFVDKFAYVACAANIVLTGCGMNVLLDLWKKYSCV